MNNKVAKDFVVIPNPDFMHRKKVEEAIKANDGYCCCALEKNEDTKCMCKEFREQINDPNFEGFCHCQLYYKAK